MSEEEKNAVEKAMEKDCIILFTTNEVLAAMKNVIEYSKPGWFDALSGGPTLEIDTKCRGPACAAYNVFTNTCGLVY